MKKLLTALVLFIGSSAPLRAEEPVVVSPEAAQAKPQPSREAAEQMVEKKDAAQENAGGQKSQSSTGESQGGQADKPPADSSGQPQAFSDRDGDGIQDGKEYRFRGKHRHGSRRGQVEESGESGKNRHRARGSTSGR